MIYLPGGTVVNAEVAVATAKIICEIAGEDLYTCVADGSGFIFLGEGEQPHWLQGRQHLACMIASDDGEQIGIAVIHLMRADGSDRRNFTATLDRLEMNCFWSPDSKSLAFDEPRSGAIWLLGVRE